MDNPSFPNTVEDWRQFADGCAFELRNVLMVVKGYAELSRERLEPTHPVAKDMALIVTAADRAYQVATALKNAAQPERQRSPNPS